jgi:hypothetical protein
MDEKSDAERAARKQNFRLALKEGLLPFGIQLVLLVFVILFFLYVIANPANPRLPNAPDLVVDGEVINDPNIVRFVFMILTFFIIPGLVFFASRSQNIFVTFWLSLIAGIMMWQGLGECSWHFGFAQGSSVIFMPAIEGRQGTALFFFLMPVLVYFCCRKDTPFFMKVFLLTFLGNWAGHWLLLGIGSFFPTDWAFNGEVWQKVFSCGVALPLSFYILYLLFFKAKTTQDRLLASLLLYATFGTFAEGIFETGA